MQKDVQKKDARTSHTGSMAKDVSLIDAFSIVVITSCKCGAFVYEVNISGTFFTNPFYSSFNEGNDCI